MVQSTLALGVIMSVFHVLTQVTASRLRDSRGWAAFCGQEARFGGWLTSQVSGKIGAHTPLSHTRVLILQQQADCSGLQLLSKSHCSVNLRILSVMSKLLPTSQWSRSVSSWTGVVCQFNKIWTFFFFKAVSTAQDEGALVNLPDPVCSGGLFCGPWQPGGQEFGSMILITGLPGLSSQLLDTQICEL